MSTGVRVLLSALVVGALGALAGAATWSSFSGTSASVGNTFASGTVSIADNDGGSAALSLSGARPGDTVRRCLSVTYGGSLEAGVRLFGSVTGALAPHLTLEVTRGTEATPDFSGGCATFSPDPTDHEGDGPGVVYHGPLADLPADWAEGLVDPEPWTNGERHSFRFAVTVADELAAQNAAAAATFTWEARNT